MNRSIHPAIGSSTGQLPRLLTKTVMWTGRCLTVTYQGEPIHSHLSAFLIKGSTHSLLVDTGIVAHFPQVLKDVEGFLGEAPLDYVFPTHAEMPHSASLPFWCRRYPNCAVVGNVGDFALHYPALERQLRPMKSGDEIDLGDRKFLFLPAVWRDLPSSLWGFDTKDRILFVSDGFSFLHGHKGGQCDLLTSEMPLPDLEQIRFFNTRALQWTKYVDIDVTSDDVDSLLRQLNPRLIASAHGCVINTPSELLPLIKAGMIGTA